MNSILRYAVEKGFGKAALTTVLKQGATAFGVALVALLMQSGVSADSLAGITDYLVGIVPIVVSVLYSYLEHKFGVSAVNAAITANPEEIKNLNDVKALLKYNEKI